jgi:hypothetical protein
MGGGPLTGCAKPLSAFQLRFDRAHLPAPFQSSTRNLNRYRKHQTRLILRQSLVYRTKECFSTSLRNRLVSRPSRLLTPARTPTTRVTLPDSTSPSARSLFAPP